VLVLRDKTGTLLPCWLARLNGGSLTTGANLRCAGGTVTVAPLSSFTTAYLTGADDVTFFTTDITTLPEEFFTKVATAGVDLVSVCTDDADERMMKRVAGEDGLLLLLATDAAGRRVDGLLLLLLITDADGRRVFCDVQ